MIPREASAPKNATTPVNLNWFQTMQYQHINLQYQIDKQVNDPKPAHSCPDGLPLPTVQMMWTPSPSGPTTQDGERDTRN